MRHKGRTGLAARGTRGSGLIYSQSPTSFPFSKSLQARCSEWEREQKHQPPPSGSGFRGRPSLRVSGTSPAFHKVTFFATFLGSQRGMGKEGNPGQPLESALPQPAQASSVAHYPRLPASCAASRTPAPGSAAPRPSNAAAPLISSTRGTYRGGGAAFSKQDPFRSLSLDVL